MFYYDVITESISRVGFSFMRSCRREEGIGEKVCSRSRFLKNFFGESRILLKNLNKCKF